MAKSVAAAEDAVDRESRSFLERARRVVTVEPASLMFQMSFMFLFLTNEQYVYARFLESTMDDVTNMTSLNDTVVVKTECGQLEMESEVQLQADADAAKFMTVYSVIFEVPCVLLAFFWGSYSDYIGRKRALLLPVIGSLARVIIAIVAVSLKLNIFLLYLGCIIDGLFGGPAVFLGAVFAYIADITNRDNRSQRTAVIQAMVVFGPALSQLVVGYTIDYAGFLFAYIIAACVIVINLLYIKFWVLESVQTLRPCSFFRLQHVKNTVMLFFRDDGTGRLWKLQTGLAIIGLHYFMEVGSFPMLILFILTVPYCFSASLLGGYLSLCNVLNGFGTIGTVYVFYKSLGDYTLLIIANTASLVSHIWLALPFLTSALIFVTPFLNFMANAMTPITRSIISKATAPEEQGTLSAGVMICTQVSGLVGSTVFGPIYANTVGFYRGTVWIVASGVLILPVLLSIYMGYRVKKQEANPDPNEETKLTTAS